MTLSEYLKINGMKATADRLGIATPYLWQIANGARTAGHELAIAIERETNGAVTVAELRPAFAESLKAAGYVKIEKEAA